MPMRNDLFWKLLEPEHPRAEAFCRRLTGSREDGDDLYQDALLRAMDRFGTLKDLSAFRSWLYRLLVNCYRNRYRSPWWRRRAELTDEALDSRACDDPTDRRTARRWLDRAFAVLAPDERALVTLHELESWSIAELAGLYGRPEGTIKARLSRARRKMRSAVEAYLSTETSTAIMETKGSICVAPKPNAD